MADDAAAGVDRAAAVDTLDQWLQALGAESLGPERASLWTAKRFTHGWRLPTIDMVEPVTLELYVDECFPWTAPRLWWPAAPSFPSFPHIETDGLICALPAADSLNPFEPIGLAKAVLVGAVEILEAGFAGSADEDFATEFQTYWRPMCSRPPIVSLLDPSGPSRTISVWRGKDAILVAEHKADITRWLTNRHGKRVAAKAKLEGGALVWINRPLLPSQYPASVDDLHTIANGADDKAGHSLASALGLRQQKPLILLGSSVGDSVSFAAVELLPPPGRESRKSLVDGFRPGKEPPSLLIKSRASSKVRRAGVERADPSWIHGRDQNPDILDLFSSNVTVIGCGSLGAPVASLLARGGVGRIRLIDPQALSWANVGRHVLGSSYVHVNKAMAMQIELSKAFPSHEFLGHSDEWRSVAYEHPEQLLECDLIISTIGEWSHEAELNDWALKNDKCPGILFGWSEELAAGGQAVLTGTGSGCLACGLDEHGGPLLRIAAFPQQTLHREASCGAWFQPYGAAQIMAVGVIVADMALDYLCGRAAVGTHRMMAASARRIEQEGGQLTDAWIARSGGRIAGGNLEEDEWPARTSCRACRGSGR
jgi:hypothetical protein